jgi:hypothetical protein
MHAGWLAGRRALGEIGRSVRLFRFFTQHPVAATLVSDGGKKRFWKKMSRHGALVARFCGCHA